MRPLHVMIIEDNSGDAFLISLLLEDIGIEVRTTIAKDGKMALDILNKEKEHQDVSSPDLVILDLNLPKINGFEVLKRMRSDPQLRSIQVVVMTGSLNKDDEIRAREIGVDDYKIKPLSRKEMDLTSLWLKKHLTALAHKGASGSVSNTSGAQFGVHNSHFNVNGTPDLRSGLYPDIDMIGHDGHWDGFRHDIVK